MKSFTAYDEYRTTQTATEACDVALPCLTPVAEAFAQLETEQDRLRDALDHLIGRLDEAMSPPTPETDKCGPGRPHESELHGRILGHVFRTRSAAELVERVLTRLTL